MIAYYAFYILKFDCMDRSGLGRKSVRYIFSKRLYLLIVFDSRSWTL